MHRREPKDRVLAERPRGSSKLGNAAAAVLKHVHDWAGRLVAATKSSRTPLRWLLGTAPKFRCSIGASGWPVSGAAAGRPIWC
jgi:hypothetical protein